MLSKKEILKKLASGVMNWEPYGREHQDLWKNTRTNAVIRVCTETEQYHDRFDVANPYILDWSPLDNPSDAKIILERMRHIWKEDNTEEPRVWDIKDDQGSTWIVSVYWTHHDGPIHIVSHLSESLEEAICYAALKERGLIDAE